MSAASDRQTPAAARSPGGGPPAIRIATAAEFVRLWNEGRWALPEGGPDGPSSGLPSSGGGRGRTVAATVADIISQVRSGGREALRRLTLELDGADLDTMEISRTQLEDCASRTPPNVRKALAAAGDRIARFAGRCLLRLGPRMPDAQELLEVPGGDAWEAWCPLRRVGFYVPGGRAPYPSSVLMSIVPASVAGVGEKVLCTPPRADGTLDPAVAAAALIAGADRVFRLGGAQAVAAMALGAGEVPQVDKVVGPGNVYVTEAKRQLFGQVGVDGLAGPSEFMAVSDREAEGKAAPSELRLLAWQLLAQAEHDGDALAVTVLFAPRAASTLAAYVERGLRCLPAERRATAATALARRGALLVAGCLEEAATAVEAVRPEHLWLDLPDEEAVRRFVVRCAGAAGAVFIGPCSPVALGDYVAGPSHVLPTGGSAAWGSPLGVAAFMRRVSLVRLTAGDAVRLERAGTALAEYEGFTAHARSIRSAAGWARRFGGVRDGVHNAGME